MIAKLNIKLCPFRKKVFVVDYKLVGQGDPIIDTEEDFLECLEKDCAMWGQKEHTCLLARKEEVKEKDKDEK